MNDFDFSLYDPSYLDDEQPDPKRSLEVKPKMRFEEPEPKKVEEPFDFSQYEDEETHPYFGQYAHLTPSEYKKLSPEKKKELQEYSPLKGFAKGALSGLTLGATEHIPGLKPEEHEAGSGIGEFVGAAAPIAGILKVASYPFNAIKGLLGIPLELTKKTGLGARAISHALDISKSATVGAGHSLGKQTIKGEGISGREVAEEAAMFGGTHALISGVIGGGRWLNSLRTGQRAKLLSEGVIGADLDPNQYKFFEQEIVPELQKSAEQKYKQALQEAVEANDKEFAQKMQNIKAKHEDDLYRQAQEQKMSEEDFTTAKQKYQNELKQVAAEHEAKVEQIQKENQEAIKSYEEDKKAFQKMKERQIIVKDAITPKESEIDLKGRVKAEGENIGFRPAPGVEKDPSLRNKVGKIFSDEVTRNESASGLENVKAIRANDNFDYQQVRDAYTISDKLGETVQGEHSGLALELVRLIDELKQIPELSPPRKQLLTIAEKILNKIGIFNDEGVLIGFNKVSNKILQDQAKELRYFMDFNFEHGNNRAIFTPLVNTLEDAAESAAINTGNQAAYDASRKSRSLYRQWAKDYDNDYIRPFRDTKNHDYIKLFNKTLDPDTYPVVNNILNRSNAGQQISKADKRALIENELKPFFGNRGKVDTDKFEDALKRIRGIITPEEERAIHEAFAHERRTPVINGKKAEIPEGPKGIKELPQAKIPLFEKQKRKVGEITEVKIPLKPDVKPTKEMQASAKIMKIKPEQALKMTENPSGLKELKDNLSKPLFKKVGQHKVKDILFEGRVERKFTGDELYDIINKGNNYALLSEILGEDVAADLLVNSREIAGKSATVKAFKKVGMHASTLKTLMIFGIL
jgi:hypothetical protein